ncbi:hypothetical protein EDC94DRAFT_610142 [Helicostylum pulchrum]|nr:hypothetical protein EDC94DRAFT_610142 [Helicostylum pulchrum]
MGNWSTLNKGVTASTKDAVEIQVEQLLETYQNTLKYHQQGQLELAKERYKKLASHALVNEEPKPKQNTAANVDLVEESPLSTLRFLVFKNYASILEEEYKLDLENTTLGEEVLNNYLRAVKIDPTDYTLWYHIGHISQTLKKLRFARLAYETGFYVNDDERTLKLHVVQPNDAIRIVTSGNFTPMQWKCLEGLCTVLYDIGDYRLCESYVDIIMSLVDWDVGAELRNKIRENSNIILDSGANDDSFTSQCEKPKTVPIMLEKPDWPALVESLFKEYNRVVADTSIDDRSTNTEIAENNLFGTIYINQAIHITVEEEEQKLPPSQPMEIDSVLVSPPPVPAPTIEPEKQSPLDPLPKTNRSSDIPIESNVDVNMTDEPPVNPNKRKRENDETDNEENTENAENTKNTENTENNSENEEGSENDEEGEAEEKRLSLRASKRQLEKIANEEFSRRKMLEEEKDFINKVQNFYNMLESIPTLYREQPWYTVTDTNGDSLNPFWEWFDHKISELGSSYCWDIDTSVLSNNLFLKTDPNMFGDSKVKNLALFSRATTVESNGPPSTTSAKDFITNLNNNNSGITDSLCKLISAIVHEDCAIINNEQKTISTMSNKFLNIMTDTITSLGLNLVESVLSSPGLSENDKIMALLRICEYFIDRLIRDVMATAEEAGAQPPVGNHSKRRVSMSSVKISKAKMTESLLAQSRYWISLLERIMFSSTLNEIFLQITQDESNDSDQLNLDRCTIQLRYWSLKGKLAQCDDAIESAYSWYIKSKTLLSSSSSLPRKDISIDIKSMYDATIDLPSINAKLSLLEVGKLFVTAKQKLGSENYEGVIEDLESVIKPKLSTEELTKSNEMIQMTNMLAKAYTKTNKSLEAWNCYTHMFCYLIKQLVDYGRKHNGCELPYLRKNEDVGFFKSLSLINSIMDNLISLTQQDNSESWLPADMDIDLANRLSILLRMSIYYIFRHPDFVPLVNNFTVPDMPPHTPSRITKSNGFNDIMIKSWVLKSYLIQHTLRHYGEPVNDTISTWSELLKELHDELGEREVCGAAKRIFLTHLMATLTKADDTHFRRDIYQCYHCLYGVHLAAESDTIEEHHCIHSDLDQKASEPLFELIVDSAFKKLERRSLLKADLKDVIDTVSDLFEELPVDNVLVENNKNVIQAYLNSDLGLHYSVDSMLRTSIIPTMNIPCEKTKISKVYYKIFWIRGKTLRLHIKNKVRASNEKLMIDLEKAVEEFTSHLILNPDDVDGWCELGACYQLHAEVELDWSAHNIEGQKNLIGEYQKKSCHAYLRSLYLANSRTKKELAKNELFTNFGIMAYSMASSPMDMEAFKGHVVKRILGENGKVVETRTQPPCSKIVYKLSIIMYNHALRYKIPDSLEWRCYYMIGKCSAKIGRPPREVLEWYMKAISRASSKSGKHELDFDPIYIFCSYLVKYFYQGKLQTKDVEELLAAESLLHKNPHNAADQDIIFLGSSNDRTFADKCSTLFEELDQQTGHLPADCALMYNAIFIKLSEMRVNDSKNSQHRTIYRMAWMYYHIYRNAEKAKSEIMKLFNLKVLTKSYISIWKPGFELPGRHYKYISKYTLFLIDLAKVTGDTQTLKYLCRKLRRAQTTVLNDKLVYKQACAAYFEVAKDQLRNKYHAKIYMKMIKDSKIDKAKFEELCAASSAEIIADKSVAHPDLYAILQDIAEIKRSINSFILMNCAEEEGMDKVIRMCYAALIFGGVLNDAKCDILSTAIPIDGEVSIESRSRKDLRVILLAQAKLLMQTMVVTSK